MADDELKAEEKAGPAILEKKNLMIAGILVGVLIIAFIAVVMNIHSPADKGTAQPISPGLKRKYLLHKPKTSRKQSARQVPRLSGRHQQSKKLRHHRSILSSSPVTR
jgi:hypothetical protein